MLRASCGTLSLCVLEPCTAHRWIWLLDKTHQLPIWWPILLVPWLSYFGEAKKQGSSSSSTCLFPPRETTLTRVKQWRWNPPDDGADRLCCVRINHYSITSQPQSSIWNQASICCIKGLPAPPSTSSSLGHDHWCSTRRHSNSTRA